MAQHGGMTHEVALLCDCTDDPCRTEVYASDVRLAFAELDNLHGLRQEIERVWHASIEVMRKP